MTLDYKKRGGEGEEGVRGGNVQGRDVCQSLAGGWILTVREMELIWTPCYCESLDTKLPANVAGMLK